MPDGHGLFRLQLVLGTAGMAAAALSAVTAAVAIDPELPTPAALRTLCMGMFAGQSELGRLLVLALAGIGLAVPLRGIVSVVRQVRATRRLCRALPVEETRPGSPPVVVVQDERPLAFCCGLLRPRVFVSTGARQLLDEGELHAVLVHERHHARRRDPLRLLVARALRDAVFFVPVLTLCQARFSALAELAADRSAMAAAGVGPLAGALAVFDSHGGPLTAVSNERVDHLQGAPADWGVSRRALLAGLSSLAGVAALAALTAAVLGGRHVSLIGLMSTVCGVVVVGLPIVAAWLAMGPIGSARPGR